MKEEIVQIEIFVENIVYKNLDSGFAVVQGSTDNYILTAVGELASVEAGEELIASGSYIEHPKFGSQFKVEAFDRKLPTTVHAIKKFLASGAVKGIGPVLAERIVDCFGAEALEKIQDDPACLEEIKGISPSKAAALSKEFEKLFSMRKLLLFLEQFSIKPTECIRAWMAYGSMALDVIRANPYRLCDDEIGITFAQADLIAEHLAFGKEDDHRVLSGFYYVLRHNAMNNGHSCIPRESLLSVSANLLAVSIEQLSDLLDLFLQEGKLYALTIGKELIFLPNYYFAESYIAQRIAKLLDKSSMDLQTLETVIDMEEERSAITFAVLQRKAIRDAIANGIFILTGGPGTGKTTILKTVISIMEQQGYHVGICAPTGRAAKRLSELSEHEATTIHRMLGVQRRSGEKIEFVHNQGNPLKFDAIIVDEMSMVDSLLFSSLLKASKADCKFILTGDVNQLPSVAAGNVLKELLQSGCIPSVELKEIFRQSAQSLIVTNAHAIVHGDPPDLKSVDNDFFFMVRNDLGQAAQTIAQLCAVRLPRTYQYSPFDDIQVICPSKKTLVGTVELNKLIQSAINPPSKDKDEFHFGEYDFRVGDKVMQVRNNYDIVWKKDSEEGQGIFNGDIGRIVDIHKMAGTIQIDFDGRLSVYTFEMAKELELAYAITIHKSQGNEFPAVIIPVLGKKTEFYNRNLLYTGITRAKEMIILVGTSQHVADMVSRIQVNFRYTGLQEMIKREVLHDEDEMDREDA